MILVALVALLVELVLFLVTLVVEKLKMLDEALETLATFCTDGVYVKRTESKQVGTSAVVFDKQRQPFLELIPDAITFSPFAYAVPTGTIWAEKCKRNLVRSGFKFNWHFGTFRNEFTHDCRAGRKIHRSPDQSRQNLASHCSNSQECDKIHRNPVLPT